MPSRWAESENDKAEDARRKAEKEEKKRLKLERQRQAQEAQARTTHDDNDESRPTKRRRLSHDDTVDAVTPPDSEAHLLRFATASWQPCRSVGRFDRLNHIEEGSYGYVSRAREEATNEIVAIKKLKLDSVRDAGFAVTALREIQCLQAARHRHVVDLREVVTEGRDVYLVMEFVEHDLKSLQEEMQDPFSSSEVKTLLLQLGSAVEFLHDHYILHRDLKTSNILMNNRGEIKLADFGMARVCSEAPPPANLTQLVVTLWYRAPELLLGTTTYGKAVDAWSVGCILGELLTRNAMFQGKNEVDQLSKIFETCGIPTEESWPGFKRLPNARSLRLPYGSQAAQGSLIRSRFSTLTNAGVDLLNSLLNLNPTLRMNMKEMLTHSYFSEAPRPKPTSMFPTFPSKAGQEKRRRQASPNAPKRGVAPSLQGDIDMGALFKGREMQHNGSGFQLKLA